METTGYPNDEIDLAGLNEEFADVEPEEREFDPVPDGKYQVVVDRVELTRAKSSGTPMLKWSLKILGPTHKGRLLWRNNLIAPGNNLKWLKTDLYTCGLELENITELKARLEELLDVKLEVTKKTNGDYENVYLNRRIVLADDAGYEDDGTPF